MLVPMWPCANVAIAKLDLKCEYLLESGYNDKLFFARNFMLCWLSCLFSTELCIIIAYIME